MDSYSGGWQVLVPHAGPSTTVDGVERRYHGQASALEWELTRVQDSRIEAHVRLTELPFHIQRSISVNGDVVSVEDSLHNMSDQAHRYVYQHHPAFGAPFLGPMCEVELPGDDFFLISTEPGGPGGANPRHIPALDGSRLFGAVAVQGAGRARVSNPLLGLAVELSWDDPDLRYAWIWRESGASVDSRWAGGGYVYAIEPSTTPPGADNLRMLTLEPGGRRRFTVAVGLTRFIPTNATEKDKQ
ncbi:hypothetical protein GCM10009807_32750 [Microbacterium lacus]|uniref:DUF4432 domain-containing protein n=2 Tax=Microbacterium lacus TaxID=415217 RepID=A0ABP4TE19_9MICO